MLGKFCESRAVVMPVAFSRVAEEPPELPSAS
jgi:hypothetical protein